MGASPLNPVWDCCAGLTGATAPGPSKDACSQPHTVAMQGSIKTATQSRYARMHKDSHTKPLHDATAQMAVIAQMQRHKWLSLHRCNGTNGCHCTDAMAQMAVIAQMQWYKWLTTCMGVSSHSPDWFQQCA